MNHIRKFNESSLLDPMDNWRNMKPKGQVEMINLYIESLKEESREELISRIQSALYSLPIDLLRNLYEEKFEH
jgi:hypothetical protein